MTLNLNQSYEEFISQFSVYKSYQAALYKKASNQGFEVHHIIPKAVQRKEQGKVYDDRCVILTCYEHILAHYFYCKTHPEDSTQPHAFTGIYDFRKEKLTCDEKKLIEELPQFEEIRKKGYERGSHPAWNKGIPCDEKKKAKISLTLKSKKLSSWNKGVPCTQERKEKISNTLKGHPSWNKGKKVSEDTRKKMAESSCKKIYQCSLSGELINEFKSREEASEKLGVSLGTVTRWIKGEIPQKYHFQLSYTK